MRGESPIASNGTECAQIISDDHLDFSSTAHGPSVKTRWLPGDATTSSDKSGEEAVVSLQNAGDEKPVIGPDIVTRLTVEVADASNVPKEIVSTTAKFSDPGLGALESSVNNDEPRGADCSTDIAKEGSHLQPPLSPAPVEDGRRSPHHRQMVDRGKAMIQKLLTEGNNVNCRPRLGSERQCDTYTKAADENLQKTRSFADFTDENMDQSIPFRATREDVFCTSSQESINEDANASFDDDIAAAFTHPLQTVAKIKKVETHVITTKESKPSEAQVTATPTNTPSTPLLDEPIKQELFTEEDLKVRNTNDRLERDEHDGFPNKKAESEVTSEPPHFGDNRNLNESGQDSTLPVECAEPNKTTSVNGTGNEFAEVIEKTSGQVEDSDYPKSHVLEAIQEKSEEFVDGGTSTVKERELESVRPIKEEIEEKIGEPPTEKAVEPSEERPPQKKFMSGGFGSSGSSGFVSFGSSAAEKENVAAFGPIEFHSAEKSGGFDGERGGGGFGRGDQRGGRGRSFDRDGQRFRDSRDGRDSYRDRDGRDGNRDGFRSRGGYGGGGGRDSQGRSGFRGSRM